MGLFNGGLFSYGGIFSGPKYDIYVNSIDGDDSYPGSISQPFRTLAAAVSAATTIGTSVRIGLARGSSWREKIDIAWSGVSNNRAVIGAYGYGDNPLLNGSQVLDLSAATLEGGYTYTYSVSAASDPLAIWESDVYMTKKTSIAEVEATAGTWYFIGGKIYAHAFDGSNPSTNGKLYEKFQYMYNLLIPDSSSYIDVRDIVATKTWGEASGMYGSVGGLTISGANININRVVSEYHNRHGITLYETATNCLVNDCTVRNTYSTTPIAVYGADTDTNAILNSTIACGYTDYGIVVHGGATNTTIDNCVFLANRNGIIYGVNSFDAGTDNITINRCTLSGRIEVGLNIKYSHNAVITNNIIDDNASSGTNAMIVMNNGAINWTIANNTVRSTKANYSIQILAASTGGALKNNIIRCSKAYSISADSLSGFSENRDDFYGTSGSFINYGGTTYSVFATYQSGTGQSANSINVDPLFVNLAASDFHLQSGSPCIGAADDSVVADYYGNNRVSPHDMGAIEYAG